MKEKESKPLLARFRQRARKILQELKAESVASNPVKPVDCCNPPAPPGRGKGTGSGTS